ncbi:MAG: hypothetical protein R3D98_15275 [Candidatus Krumholzibacteriia bacterium]
MARSSDLTIRLDHDLPAMTVDVVAPDFQVVRRILLTPGDVATVSVPSEQSFLRVHHPSGETIVLTDPGRLQREIPAAAFTPAMPTAPPNAPPSPAAAPAPAPGGAPPNPQVTLSGGGAAFPGLAATIGVFVRQLGNVGQFLFSLPWPGRHEADARETAAAPPPTMRGCLTVTLEGEPVTVPFGVGEVARREWQPLPACPPGDLVIELDTGARLSMRLPAATRECRADLTGEADDDVVTVKVRLRTNDPVADAMLNYLRRGDVTAAAAMEAWAESSHEMLMHKMSDPYAASVGAYLLLRLHRFDLLHDWPRNLADWFDFLPDGGVIWAWQLIHQDPGRRAEILEYFELAIARGLPVYTPGLRLLLDGLSLLGDPGKAALARLQPLVGTVLWESPLTARVTLPRGSRPVRFDVGFGVE